MHVLAVYFSKQQARGDCRHSGMGWRVQVAMAMRGQEGWTSLSSWCFRYNYAKMWTEEMYHLVDSEHPLFVPVPRDQVGLCHLEDPRGWKEQGPSCEGMWYSHYSCWWEGCGRKCWKPSIFLLFFLSKGIADYITRCKQAIGKFESLVHQIHKNADDISSRLTLIESINLFKYPAPKSEDELPGRSGFFFLLIMGGKSLGHDSAHTHTFYSTNGIKPCLTISGSYLKT